MSERPRRAPFPDVGAAWRHLAQVTDYERMDRFGRGRAHWDLETPRALLAALGDPDRAYPILHVVGTKGKGSTAFLLEAALRAAGLRTGLYVSPHVDHPWERIQINGRSLAPAAFLRWMNRLHPILEAMEGRATFFEIFTVLALAAFREAGVEVAVVEAGLGGRWDATNAVARPALTVITSVSRDHVHLLGEAPRAIAREKAAVLRPGVPAVCGLRPGERAGQEVLAAAARMGAPLWMRPRDFALRRYFPRGAAAEVDLRVGEREVRALRLGLWGLGQGRNAALALAALTRFLAARGRPLPLEPVREAWASLQVPGRLEVLGGEPLLVVDGAHNAASVRALLASLRLHFPGRRLHLVLAMRDDKLLAETAVPLLRAARTAHLAPLGGAPSAPPATLAALAPPGTARVTVHPEVGRALEAAREAARPEDLVLVTGSLYLAGEVRALLGAAAAQAPPPAFR